MGVECTGRNVEVTPSLRRLAEKRARRLERHLGGPADIWVVLSHEKHRFGAEVIATHRRRRWKAAQETGDPRAAVALAFEKIDAQAKKDSERRHDRKGRPSVRLPPATETAAPARPRRPGSAAPAGETRIVRAARQPIKPMSVEEAALRIESLGLEFVVFRDSGSEKISVLYRRRDENLGLIVPER
jgi:putative sigma-54 modulation protein